MSSTTLEMYHVAVNELNLWFPLCPEPEVVPRIYSYCVPVPPEQEFTFLTQNCDIFSHTPYNRKTWKDFARLEEPKRDYTYVLSALKYCMSALPQAVYPVVYYARALWAINEYQKARQLLQNTLVKHPHHVFAMQILGETCFFSGHYHEATALLQTVIDEEPERTRPYVALALVVDHLARQESDNEERATLIEQMVNNLQTALTLAPEKLHALNPLLKSARLRLAEFRV